jgi:hypothetical protein
LEQGAVSEVDRILKLEAAVAKLTTPYDPQVQWTAGMETGNLNEWAGQNNSGNALSVAIKAATDGILARTPWVMKQSVSTLGGTRMYTYDPINKIYRNGNPFYYSFYAYFTQALTFTPAGFFSLLQIQSQGPSGIDPVWILGLHPLNFTLRMEWWGSLQMAGPHTNESGGIAYDQSTPLPLNQWTKIDVMVIPREDFTGAVKVWQDNKVLFDLQNVKTKYPESLTSTGAQSFFISKNAYGQVFLPLSHSHYVDDVTISLGRMP